MTSKPLAIVGMSCRFPKGEDEWEYWQLLESGGNGIAEVPADRWRASDFYDPERGAKGKMCTRWGGWLQNIDGFDHKLFGVPVHEAARMDPQQRLSMELAWEALENAGYCPKELAGSNTAIVLGIAHGDHNRLHYRDLDSIDAFNGTNTYLSVAANRISFALDLSGPSLAIDTACSSSLYAFSIARLLLEGARTDLALVGGVNLNLSPEEFISLSHAGLMALDGQCKTFDARADGYVRGEGGAFLAVTTLEKAQREGLRVRALIRSEATNVNGRTNGLTAPRGAAQRVLLREAWTNARLDESQIASAEVHGTGTLFGDRIELVSLRQELESLSKNFRVAVSTAKTNIGHLEAASGVAGVVKVVLSMEHDTIAPHRNLETPADGLPLDENLYIPREPQPWPASKPFGIVSAFGFGGANAHVVLEKAPGNSKLGPCREVEAVLPFAFSAPSETMLERMGKELADHIDRCNPHIVGLARTLAATRTTYRHRRVIFARSLNKLREQLRATEASHPEDVRGTCPRREPRLYYISGSGTPKDETLHTLLTEGQASFSEFPRPEHAEGWQEACDETLTSNVESLLVDPNHTLPPHVILRECASVLRTGHNQHEWHVLAEAWCRGIDLKWARLLPNAELISLPTFPFEHTVFPREPFTASPTPRHEVDSPQMSQEATQTTLAELLGGLLGGEEAPAFEVPLKDLGLDSIGYLTLEAELGRLFGRGASQLLKPEVSLAELTHALAQPSAQPRSAPTALPWGHFREDFPEHTELDRRLQLLGPNVGFFAEIDYGGKHVSKLGNEPLINFTTYNYLGLAGNEEVARGAAEAASRWGTSACASRVAGGQRPIHRVLESEIADFLGTEDALVFVGGHATNVSVLGHLAAPEDVIISDELIHNSCVEGALRSGATHRTFRHNDTADLAKQLRSFRSTARRCVVVVEGTYSMDGDLPPLREIVDMAHMHNCVIMVDEAHSVGVLGPTGRGISEHAGVSAADVDIWMGTLSKSLSSCGGYIAGRRQLIRYLKYTCPGFVFSVGISPMNAGAALASLRILRKQPELVRRVRSNAQYFQDGLRSRGWDVGSSHEDTPVVPLILRSERTALAMAKHLREHGIFALPMLPPSVPENQSRIRFFITANHSKEELERTLTVLDKYPTLA